MKQTTKRFLLQLSIGASVLFIGLYFYNNKLGRIFINDGNNGDGTGINKIVLVQQPPVTGSDLRRSEVINPLFNDGPERRNPYIRNINIPTQGETSYSMVGFLFQGADRLPLYGRPQYTGSNRWDYYTKDESRNVVPIPLDIANDKELLDGDSVSILSYDGDFTTKIYDVNTPRYLPGII